MMKVVEYLKYHEEHECSEICIPLAGDNLQDCGASRWDSSFVNVDRELLFDLTVAASYLDIASLWLLLSAKAALLTNNKSCEKLRKELRAKWLAFDRRAVCDEFLWPVNSLEAPVPFPPFEHIGFEKGLSLLSLETNSYIILS